MKIKILHIFEDLMNLYGEYANVSVLERYLIMLGHEVQVEKLGLYEQKDISGYDFYYMGSGTEGKQKLALSQLEKYSQPLKTAFNAGKVMLFTGNSMELLGKKIVDAEGKEYDGIAMADFVTTEGKKRIVTDALADHCGNLLVGFINKSSKTSGITSPLFTMKMGFGNDKDKGAEGFCQNNCYGTHLTGPILVKNPYMLRLIAQKLVGEVDPSVGFDYMEKSYQITCEALKKRLEEQK